MPDKQNQKRSRRQKKSILFSLVCLVSLGYLLVGSLSETSTASADLNKPMRRVNVPYLGVTPSSEQLFEPSIFWFGKVTPISNYADVRMWYYGSDLKVMINIIDRRLWYDKSPSDADLTNWDTVTLNLDLNGNTGNTPTPNSYRFVAQLHRFEPAANYQVAYRGNGSGWDLSPTPFTTETTWRGQGTNDDANDHGWQVIFTIPFTSLGLASMPVQGTSWGLATIVHDRDDVSGTLIPDQVWPEQLAPNVPATWGQLTFGMPGYGWPEAVPKGMVTIRQGLNGASVIDGHVGGHGNCGAGLDIWSEWGDTNYGGWTQFNIQNQWDIADFPCFSKYYVTFPLDVVPSGKVILSAQLSLTMFGNAGGGKWGLPPDSFIEVFTIHEDWDEQTLTWNNAPLALEYISGTWVKPVQSSDQRVYNWDVSRAVVDAYQSGEPLRLAMYSIDGERHSGKYFWSSDSGVSSTSQRPTLQVIWGVSCDSPGVECAFTYLPTVLR